MALSSLLALLWNSAFRWVYLSFYPLCFTSLLFLAVCKASSDNHFAFLHFFFLGNVLITAPAREKPKKNGRRGEIVFRIKPHTRQRCSESSNIPCAYQNPDTPQRLRQNCVWVSPEEVQVSSGLLREQGLWVQQTWVWHKLSWRRSPLTHHRAARTYTELGNRLLEGTTEPCAHEDPGQRSSDPTRDSPRLARE